MGLGIRWAQILANIVPALANYQLGQQQLGFAKDQAAQQQMNYQIGQTQNMHNNEMQRLDQIAAQNLAMGQRAAAENKALAPQIQFQDALKRMPQMPNISTAEQVSAMLREQAKMRAKAAAAGIDMFGGGGGRYAENSPSLGDRTVRNQNIMNNREAQETMRRMERRRMFEK